MLSRYDSVIVRTCTYTDLSHSKEYLATSHGILNAHGITNTDTLSIIIIEKHIKRSLDTVVITNIFSYKPIFEDCNEVRSYSTGKNKSKEVIDNDYGEIIVADFNFDSLEDIAVINEWGGNGGPLYSYFIQTQDQKFLPDTFLTDSIRYFPTRIDLKTKQIITLVRASALSVSESTYKLNPKKNEWRRIGHRFIPN